MGIIANDNGAVDRVVLASGRSFEGWVALLESDPARFEEERRQFLAAEIVREYMHEPTEMLRITAALWRREQELARYGTGVARYNKAVEFRWRDAARFSAAVNKMIGMYR